MTEEERAKLRAALGSLAWLRGQICYSFAVDANFLVTSIPVATVEELIKTNKVIREVKKLRDVAYKIHAFPEHETLELTCWADAAWANRPNGKDSTEEIFIGASTQRLRQGHEECVTAIHWRSGKIERACRSPACAEVMSCLDGEDELTYLRLMWSELNGNIINPRDIDTSVQSVPAMIITDARNLYDKLFRPTPIIKGAEKRSTIEAISLRENSENTSTTLRWVRSGAMLGNSLTKTNEKGQFTLSLASGFRWRIIYDDRFTSERKRKKEGLTTLQAHTEHTQPVD